MEATFNLASSAVVNASVSELKDNLSEFLRRVQAGDTVAVTSHKRVIARITPVLRIEDKGLQRAIDMGLVKWNGGKPPRRAPIVPRADASGKRFPTTTELIREEREAN